MININRVIESIKDEKGSFIMFIASFALWMFLIGLVVDYCSIIAFRRIITIQLDHSLKTACKQLDLEKLANREVFILEDKALEVFEESFSESMDSNKISGASIGKGGYFSPNSKGLYGVTGDIQVNDFQVWNDVPKNDTIDNEVEFNLPTVHAIITVPMEFHVWRFFGFDGLEVPIHCDASAEILIRDIDGG